VDAIAWVVASNRIALLRDAEATFFEKPPHQMALRAPQLRSGWPLTARLAVENSSSAGRDQVHQRQRHAQHHPPPQQPLRQGW
jgi:hypothetical protein